MKKTFRFLKMGLMSLLLLINWIFPAAAQQATGQLDIKINILPPYPSKITDYASRPQQILLLLHNVSNIPLDVQLRGTITGDNGIVLRVDPQYKSPSAIHLNAGETRNLNGSDISQLFDYNLLQFSGISRNEVIRTNGLPEGNYQVCVQAYGYNNNQLISQPEPLGCSNIFPISSLETPVILTPFNEQSVSSQSTQNFAISWTTPAGAPPSTQYSVNMVEIFDNRNPNDAINSATSPIFFQQTVNGSNLLLYGPAMPSLTPGRKYALMVVAKDPFNSVSFRNGGRSEVISFTYGESSSANGDGNAAATGPSGNGNIPALTVKGKIDWYYRRSEERGLLVYSKYDSSKDHFSISGSGNEKILISDALNDPSFVAAVKPLSAGLSGNGNNNNSGSQYTMALLKSTKPTAPIVPSAANQLQKSAPDLMSVMAGGGSSAIFLNSAAYFNDYGTESHALTNSTIKLYAIDSTQPALVPVFAGSATTDAQGNFQISFVPPSSFGNYQALKYIIRVQNNYFTLPGFSFSIPSNTSAFDVGELKAFANTYRFLPYVLDESKTEITNSSISIYRKSDFYSSNPALKTEGNLDENNRPDTTIENQPYKKVTTIGDGYTGTRLFFSSGNGDEYKIVIRGDRLSPYVSNLAITSVITNPTTPLTIQQEYDLQPAPTTLSGQVFEQMQNSGQKIGIAGATVTIYRTEEAYNKAMHPGILEMKAPLANSGIKSVSNSSPASQPATASNQTKVIKSLSLQKTNPVNPSAGSGSVNNRNAEPITGTVLVNNITQMILADQITVTTDSTGRYTISNIKVNQNEMKVVARVPGSGLTKTNPLDVFTPGTQLPEMNFEFIFKSYIVTGRVVDEKNNAIPRAGYKWASGGSENLTDSSGYFVTSNKAGTDTLIVSKMGYEINRILVPIKGDLLDTSTQTIQPGTKIMKIVSIPSGNKISNDRQANFTVALQNSSNYQQSLKQGAPISAGGSGFIPSDKTTISKNLANASWINSIIGPKDNPSGTVDLAPIVLKKDIGRMLISVRDANNKPVSNASILIEGSDSAAFITNSNGDRYIEGPGGTLSLDISGPSGSHYVPVQVLLTVSDQDTTKKTVQLAEGITISGSVKANGSVVAGADIKVEGLDYINTISDKSGNYSLVVLKNTSYTLKASKSGFVSDSSSQKLAANAIVNFTLTSAGFDISSLLGFPVQIDHIENEANGNKKLTGSFVNLPNNPVFSLRKGSSISFAGVEVSIRNNIPVPVSDVINTDITELPLKTFNFLPVKLTNAGNPIVVRKTGNEGTAGQIEGQVVIDYSSFMPSGIAPYVDASVKQYLQNSSSGSAQSIPVISSNGQLSSTSLSIGGTNQSFNLYGFTVTLDLSHSLVKSDGLHLKGMISLNNIPLISNTSLQIQDLWIGTNGYVSNVSVNMNPAPTFKIASWSASLTGLSFSDNGFSVSGNVQVQIPGSKTSSIDFANLNISNDQLYGGSFSIPSTGIDVFGIVKFLGGPTPLSFGKLGSSNVYYIGGSGTIQFPALFDNISMKFFQVQTDGQFTATVVTNIDENFYNLAQVQITDIGFHTINGPGVDVEGNFLLNAIPWIKASVGGVHFGTGGSVSVDDIGLSFDLVGVANVKADIKFLNQPDKKGFSGDGSITIIGLPGAEIGFSYFKLPNGISVSANFKANIVIPIGAIVSINNPGGGFSLNTADHSWSVNINGNVSATGLGTAVNISINVTVTNGPVITGTAGLNVLTLNIANAVVNLDVPKSLFTININAEIDLIPKVITTEGSAIFTLSAAKNDSYFMIAAQYQSSLLGIFNDRINIAAGWGLDVSKHPEYSEYTSFIDPNFLDNGILKGISLSAVSDIEFKATGDIFIASGSIWYKNKGIAKINMGIGAGNYGLDISASWDCGASISVSPFGNIASVDIGSDVGLHMDYANGCFSVGGELAAHLSASIGDCDDDCFTGICTDYGFPVGGKICAHPGLKVGYDCNSGFSFGIDL